MADTAVTQAPRLIELIAWLSQSDSGETILYKAAAKKLGVTEKQIRDDLDVLLELTSDHKDWLGSLRVGIVAGGFTVVSRGAFRRPLQLSAEEGLALLLGLGAVQGGRKVATKFSKGTEAIESAYAIGTAPSAELDGVLAVAHGAGQEAQARDLVLRLGRGAVAPRRARASNRRIRG